MPDAEKDVGRKTRALNCPTCGRFSSDCWYRPYLDEFGGDYGGTCRNHGRWSDGA